MIRLSGVSKSYGPIQAVDGVSLEIRPGETFGLLGPNGAGKTTTINILVGALRPDSGHVEIDGAADPTRPALRRKIGVAPQAVSLYDELTAVENLTFFGRLYGLTGARLKERVEWALKFAGLEDRANDRVDTYSGGMQRRLNLASALLHAPAVLLLDEPTVGVDPQSRHHILENIAGLHNHGCTVLYTTHYMEEAQRLCDRVAIMDHGKVLALDTVDTLIERYGGATIVEAEVRRPPADLSGLPGEWHGNTVRMQTQQPFDDIARLGAAGLQVVRLHVDRPDLEAVFLKLTGRRLRD